jgi:hypothetical protein
MEARRDTAPAVKMFDCVSVDGLRGSVIGFYPSSSDRAEPSVLVHLDIAGLMEVVESRLIVERPHAGWWSGGKRDGQTAGRERYEALARGGYLTRAGYLSSPRSHE